MCPQKCVDLSPGYMVLGKRSYFCGHTATVSYTFLHSTTSQIFCSPWKYSVQDLLCLPEAVDPHEVGDAAEDDQEVSPGDGASPLDVADGETQ